MSSAGFTPDSHAFICKAALYNFFGNVVYWWKFKSWFQRFT